MSLARPNPGASPRLFFFKCPTMSRNSLACSDPGSLRPSRSPCHRWPAPLTVLVTSLVTYTTKHHCSVSGSQVHAVMSVPPAISSLLPLLVFPAPTASSPRIQMTGIVSPLRLFTASWRPAAGRPGVRGWSWSTTGSTACRRTCGCRHRVEAPGNTR